MRPRGFSRTGGGLASGRLSEGHGPPAPGAPGDSMPAPCCEWALGRHTAGIFLVTTLLRFSSGSCQTEEIVSSEMNVLGKFVFPGKSCFLGPHPPVPLGLAVPHAVPRAPPHAPGSASGIDLDNCGLSCVCLINRSAGCIQDAGVDLSQDGNSQEVGESVESRLG